MKLAVKSLAAVAMATALLAPVAPATTIFPTSSGEDLLRAALASEDPEQYMSTLTPEQISKVQKAVDENLVVTAGPTIEVPAKKTVSSDSASTQATSSKCYTKYVYREFKNFTVILGTGQMNLNWCSNGTAITSYSVTGATGGSNFFTYDGKRSTYNNVGWEVRAATNFDFHMGPVAASPCIQIRGGANGLYSTRDDCNLG